MDDRYELITLMEVFDQGCRAFRIPDYQRGYSWEEEQRRDLFQDIVNIAQAEYKHYIGTIVATLTKTVESEVLDPCYDIVDGQQRLTTLIMIINEIVLQDERLNELDIDRKFTIRASFLRREETKANTLRLFVLNKEDDSYFDSIIKGNVSEAPQNKSHQNLINAKDEIGEWLRSGEIIERFGSIDIGRRVILTAVLSKLGFLFYRPENTSEVGLMFEVINNRGKPLSQLEKVKNYLVYYGTKHDFPDLYRAVNRIWGRILTSLGNVNMTSNEEEDSFLRNAWIVFEDHRKNDSHYIYDNIKKKYPAVGRKDYTSHFERLRDFVNFLEKVAGIYERIYEQKGVTGDEANKLLHISLQSTIASVLPLIVAIYGKVEDVGTRIELLDLIEKLNFRYYGCHLARRADTGQGELFGFAYGFYNKYGKEEENEKGEKTKIDSSWLKDQLLTFVKVNAADVKFVENLTLDKDEPYDYYSWGSLKYFLANYEDNLRREIGRSADLKKMLAPQDIKAKQDFYQLEHIWAKKENEVDPDVQQINKRRLGNFVLLEPMINQSVSNSRVEDKINKYFDESRALSSHVQMLQELKKIYEEAEKEIKKLGRIKKTWKYWLELYTLFFDQREAKLVNFALKRWAVPYPGWEECDVSIDSSRDSNEIYELVLKHSEMLEKSNDN